MAIYEIWADEAWTHGGQLSRYWCFFGGVMGPQDALERLDSELAKVKASFGLQGEVKWEHVRGRNLNAYRAFVDVLFTLLPTTDLRYRQVFLDRTLVKVDIQGNRVDLSDLDLQYKIYYQFLKHAFGVKHLPAAPPGSRHRVLIRLDDHSSQRHKAELESFVRNLASMFHRPDLEFDVAFRNSKKSNRLQICDLLIGAAGSHGNKMHDRRKPGQRGMSDKQKWRLEMAKYIYNRLRAFDAAERGSRAFNWFESTGWNGRPDAMLSQKLRIWKFRPSPFHVDKGWQNDHLDRQGRYQGPEIVVPPTVWEPPADGEIY